MNLNVFDYSHKSYETDIDVDDVNSLYVVVLSGDEIVTAIMNDGSERVVDAIELAGETRCENFFDGEYGVHKDDLEQWLGRIDSYDWFGRLIKNAKM